MRRRIFLFSVLLAIAATIATSILVTMVSYNDYFDSIKREVIAEATYIVAGYNLGGEAYLQELAHPAGHRITLIAPGGEVLFDSTGNVEQMDNHGTRPEVLAALTAADGKGECTRYSDTIREQIYYYATRLQDGSVLRISSATATMVASYDRLFWVVGLIVVFVFAVSVFIASLVTRRIVRPINAIDLDNPEKSAEYDEIVPLLRRIKEQHYQIETQIRTLDHERREFAAITANMKEGFLVLSRSGSVLSHNKSAHSILGTHIAAARGTNVLSLNRSEAFREVVEDALNGNTREQIVELNGRHCQLFANPVNENGELQGVILLLLDVSEKQEREKLRREFTANVSHELKTPLTVISGYAELLANGLVKPQDIIEFSQRIFKEAGLLIALVNDLMLLSGLEENAPPPRVSVDLTALSDRVVKRLAPRAEERGVTLCASGSAGEVSGIPSVLEELLYNLLDNAIKYNRDGGRAEITLQAERDTVVLRVSDTGVGIPATEHERIFERFYRVDKSRNKAVQGTGLGLSIVKHGALLHDAKLELESTEGVGTCVTLRFAALKA